MKHEIIYYTCNYCNRNLTEEGLVDENGDGGILDSYYRGSDDIDICDNPECYQRHLVSVRQQMMEDDILLYCPLDIMADEVGLEYETDLVRDAYKVKWNKNDKWHKYKKETLIKLIIPYYEKYCISGNDRYVDKTKE